MKVLKLAALLFALFSLLGCRLLNRIAFKDDTQKIQASLATSTTPPNLTSTTPATQPIENTPTETIGPSKTPSPTPSLPATITASSTPTQKPEHAPPLPSIEVSFITNGNREMPYVALTFDLCQKPEYPAWFDWGIYNALVKAGAPATFFVGGDWARTHQDETQTLANNALFELGNHSWSHPDLIDLDREAISQEVLKTQEILYQLTGRQPRLFRLPAGLYNNMVLSVIASHGLYTIQWDVVTADPVPDNEAGNINRIVRENVQNGSIIIMHANGRGWHTAEALPEMIAYLREQGYTLVTISQLIGITPLP